VTHELTLAAVRNFIVQVKSELNVKHSADSNTRNFSITFSSPRGCFYFSFCLSCTVSHQDPTYILITRYLGAYWNTCGINWLTKWPRSLFIKGRKVQLFLFFFFNRRTVSSCFPSTSSRPNCWSCPAVAFDFLPSVASGSRPPVWKMLRFKVHLHVRFQRPISH